MFQRRRWHQWCIKAASSCMLKPSFQTQSQPFRVHLLLFLGCVSCSSGCNRSFFLRPLLLVYLTLSALVPFSSGTGVEVRKRTWPVCKGLWEIKHLLSSAVWKAAPRITFRWGRITPLERGLRAAPSMSPPKSHASIWWSRPLSAHGSSFISAE